MTAKQYLSKYRACMSDIAFYEKLKEQAVVDIASVSSPQLEERVQTSPEGDPVCQLVIELERNIARYNIEILNCRVKMNIIENQIYSIREHSDDFYKLLTYRYMMGMDWNEIAQKMYKSYGIVTHLHSPALQKFDEMHGDFYRLD